MDRGKHQHEQFGSKFLNTVCSPTVLRTLLQNFLFGRATRLKIAVHAYVPASKDLCHVGLFRVNCIVTESVFLLLVVYDGVVHLLAFGVRPFLGRRACLAIL